MVKPTDLMDWDLTEDAAVGSSNRKDVFKQQLARFVSDEIVPESRLEMSAKVDSELGLASTVPKGMKISKLHLAERIPTGITNEIEQSNKRKAMGDDREHDESKPFGRPTRKVDPNRRIIQHLDRAARMAAWNLGKRRKTFDQRCKRPQKEAVDWQDFAREFRLSKRTGDSRKVPLPPSRNLQKKQKHVNKQLAFHRKGAGVIVKRRFVNGFLDKIAKLEKAASREKLKRSKKAKEPEDAKKEHMLLRKSVKGLGKEGKSSEIADAEEIQELFAEDAVREQVDETDEEDEEDDADEEDDEDEDEEGEEDDEDDDSPRVIVTRTGWKIEKDVPYVEQLRQLSKEPPTQEQIDALQNSALMSPRFLGRTVSNGRGDRYAPNMTNGFTAQDLLLPSADTWEQFRSHARLTDLNQGEIILMSGQHLAWADCRHDEFLSYSKDVLFLLVHALNRFHNGQRGVTIQ
jgi:hypothetical protein